MNSVDGISIVIPAYNEERYLPALLQSINDAKLYLGSKNSSKVEILVVNNNSTDQTERVAIAGGARVIFHETRNISSVRNAGIKSARYSIIVTVDADCLFNKESLNEIWNFMSDDNIMGASLNVTVSSKRFFTALIAKIIQSIVFQISKIKGAMFVFRKASALEMGGFSEAHFIAEDSVFAIQMAKLARSKNKKFGFVKNAGITTLERKDIRITSLPKLVVQALKGFLGVRQTSKDLPFWYDPKR